MAKWRSGSIVVFSTAFILLFALYSPSSSSFAVMISDTSSDTVTSDKGEQSLTIGGGTVTTAIISNRTGSNNNTEIASLFGSVKDLINNTLTTFSSITNNVSESEFPLINLSGSIASARFNLSNGHIEKTYTGNWSLAANGMGNASFITEFNDDTDNLHYEIDNFTANSFQRVNDLIALRGTVDVSEGTNFSNWRNTPVSIVIIRGSTLLLNFEDPDLDNLFSNQPIVGVILHPR